MISQQIYSRNCVPKFHQNRPSFIGDIIQNILVFFSGHSAYSLSLLFYF